ncbi:MAG: hypothetical protein PHD37_17245 [Gallionellaceae bacterium]|nr:hypothetical protein [Gallionellaceae bacterium]
MKNAKQGAVAEVRRFADERDALFERSREKADAEMRSGWNVDALLANPTAYLKVVFAKVGVGVVREFAGEARGLGRTHAEKLVRDADRNPDVPRR